MLNTNSSLNPIPPFRLGPSSVTNLDHLIYYLLGAGMGIDIQDFISKLTLFSCILCIQEHFLLNSWDRKHSNTNKLKKYFGETNDIYYVFTTECKNVLLVGDNKL